MDGSTPTARKYFAARRRGNKSLLHAPVPTACPCLLHCVRFACLPDEPRQEISLPIQDGRLRALWQTKILGAVGWNADHFFISQTRVWGLMRRVLSLLAT